jgi:hypothetical protein
MTTIQHRPAEPSTLAARPPEGSPIGPARAGGVLGILFVVITIGALIARGDGPLWDDPIDTIRTFWMDHGDRYLVGQYVVSLAAVILFSGFLVVLSTELGRRSRTADGVSRLVMLAGGIHLVFVLAADTAWATLASSVDRLDDQSLLLLTSLDRGAYQGGGFTMGLFVAATSVAILTGDAFPRWLGIAGFVPAVGLFVSPLSILSDTSEGALQFIGFFSSLLTMLFIVSLSVTILRRRPTTGSETAGA